MMQEEALLDKVDAFWLERATSVGNFRPDASKRSQAGRDESNQLDSIVEDDDGEAALELESATKARQKVLTDKKAREKLEKEEREERERRDKERKRAADAEQRAAALASKAAEAAVREAAEQKDRDMQERKAFEKKIDEETRKQATAKQAAEYKAGVEASRAAALETEGKVQGRKRVRTGGSGYDSAGDGATEGATDGQHSPKLNTDNVIPQQLPQQLPYQNLALPYMYPWVQTAQGHQPFNFQGQGPSGPGPHLPLGTMCFPTSGASGRNSSMATLWWGSEQLDRERAAEAERANRERESQNRERESQAARTRFVHMMMMGQYFQ